MTHLISPAVEILLVVLVVVAGVCDLRTRRIPNWLTLPAVLVGILVNWFSAGAPGLRRSLIGAGVAFSVYLALHLVHAMGAGDVKLMAAVGAFVGGSVWLRIFLLTAVLGGVCGIVLLLWRRRLRQSMWNVMFILSEMGRFRAPYWKREDLDVKSEKSLKMPHGAVITLGSLWYLVLSSMLAR